MIVEYYVPAKSRFKVGRCRTESLAFKTVLCVGILHGGIFTPSRASDIDPRIWTRNFTNLCLQEAYSQANALETFFFGGQTANSVCSCGGELMGPTVTISEAAFYSVHKQLRGDTKMRWRKGLLKCMNRNNVVPVIDAVTAASVGG